ncbi:MAG: ABC transporter permease, partial [Lachnospiraceae bacterium]|nr:ABC transporter permease [Lachnospiraceae bacterium]
EHFTEQIAAYDVTLGESAPNVEVYYNSSETESQELRNMVITLLDDYEASMANRFDVNAGETVYDCATEKDTTAQILSMMMPMLLMVFLYSGCIAVAPESIAGEKERGTMATMLVTPMKRSSLALGKLIALSIIALLSGLSSFIGTFLSLPKLMGGEELGINTMVYTAGDYALLLGIILSTVLVLVGLISILSAYAKSVKEAGTLVSPMMLLVMLMSLAPMFMGDGGKGLALFAIPVFNSALCIQGIFSFTYEPMQVVLTIVVNLAATAILTYLLKRMFDSEKIMFAK